METKNDEALQQTQIEAEEKTQERQNLLDELNFTIQLYLRKDETRTRIINFLHLVQGGGLLALGVAQNDNSLRFVICLVIAVFTAVWSLVFSRQRLYADYWRLRLQELFLQLGFEGLTIETDLLRFGQEIVFPHITHYRKDKTYITQKETRETKLKAGWSQKYAGSDVVMWLSGLYAVSWLSFAIYLVWLSL